MTPLNEEKFDEKINKALIYSLLKTNNKNKSDNDDDDTDFDSREKMIEYLNTHNATNNDSENETIFD